MPTRSARRAAVLPALSFFAIAAGCAPAPVTPPPAAPVAVVKPVAATPPAPPDLSAVPMPPDVVFAGRLSRPQQTVKLLADLLGPSMPQIASIGIDRLGALALGDALADVIDYTQPIDAAFEMSDDAKELAVSAAVTTFDDAAANLREDFRLVPQSGGVITLVPMGHAASPLASHCQLRPAFGPVSYRLVCATGEGTLERVAPYLARTVTRSSTAADAHLEFQMTPFVSAMATRGDHDDSKGSHPKSASEEAGEQMGAAMMKKMFTDTSSFAMDVTLDGAMADVALSLTFKDDRSPVTHFFLAQVRDPRPLPPTFWRLPSDADLAFYSRGLERKEYDDARAALFELLEPLLKDDGMPQPIVERFHRWTDSLFLTGGPLLVSHGFDQEAAKKSLAGAAPRTLAQKQAEARALTGYWIVELDEPTTRWVDGVHELIALDKVKYASKSKEPSPTILSFVERPIRASEGLPKGAMHLEIVSTPRAPDKAKKGETAAQEGKGKDGKGSASPPIPSSSHFYFVPEEGRTWIAIGASEAVVLAKIHALLGGTSQTLAQRAGLEGLRAGKANVAGFATLAGFEGLALPTGADDASRAKARAALQSLQTLVGRGEGPMPFFTDGELDPGGKGGRVALRIQLTRAALADFFAFVQR